MDCAYSTHEIARKKRFSDAVLAIYVTFGYLAIAYTSKADQMIGYARGRFQAGFWTNTTIFVCMYFWTHLGILVCAIAAGQIAFRFRRSVMETTWRGYPDPTLFPRPEARTMLQGSLFLLLGCGTLLFPPVGRDFLPILRLILMMVSVSLNTYFGSFWGEIGLAGLNSDDALRAAHDRWGVIFNNVCNALMVSVAGLVINPPDQKETSTPWKVYMTGFLSIYILFGGPIVWLLRPIHSTMVQIRDRMASPQLRAPDDSDDSISTI